jgi:hypothetical protein
MGSRRTKVEPGWLQVIFLAHLINDVEDHSKDLGRDRQTSIIFFKPKPLVCYSFCSMQFWNSRVTQ